MVVMSGGIARGNIRVVARSCARGGARHLELMHVAFVRGKYHLPRNVSDGSIRV